MISADGSVVAGTGSTAPFAFERQGTRWSSDGEIGDMYCGPPVLNSANSSGELSLVVDPSALPSPLGAFAPAAGQSHHFQAWYRDANPGSTSNFTSGASVPFL